MLMDVSGLHRQVNFDITLGRSTRSGAYFLTKLTPSWSCTTPFLIFVAERFEVIEIRRLQLDLSPTFIRTRVADGVCRGAYGLCVR